MNLRKKTRSSKKVCDWSFHERVQTASVVLADQYILNLSKLFLNIKDLLTECSVIYSVLDKNQTVWYIGKAKNIRKRWQGKAHHRIYRLESKKKLSLNINYLKNKLQSLSTL